MSLFGFRCLFILLADRIVATTFQTIVSCYISVKHFFLIKCIILVILYCELHFIECATSYAVLSEVTCLECQFLFSTAEVLQQIYVKTRNSHSLAARELWRIGDAVEVIVDDQEKEEEESDAGEDLDALTRERI